MVLARQRSSTKTGCSVQNCIWGRAWTMSHDERETDVQTNRDSSVPTTPCGSRAEAGCTGYPTRSEARPHRKSAADLGHHKQLKAGSLRIGDSLPRTGGLRLGWRGATIKIVLSTTPTKEEATCPPNRFPPVLLLVVAPSRRTLHGDFVDSQLKVPAKADLSMRIAVRSDPYTVVAEAKRFADSNCKHSPYDAIVRWGTIIDSNTIHVQ